MGMGEKILSSYVTGRPVRLLATHLNGIMAMAEDSTTRTHGEGECWEEDLHSLSCSEDEDIGTLDIKHTAALHLQFGP